MKGRSFARRCRSGCLARIAASAGVVGLLGALMSCGAEPGEKTAARAPSASESKPAAAPRARPARADTRMNVLLITLDTVRADSLTPYGQPKTTSPNIDRLAREGVLFEQVATSSPSTLPSHATIMTGRFPFEHGVRSNAGYVLPEADTTLAELLRSRGYRTGAEIAAPVLGRATGMDQGFDRYRDVDSEGVERIRPEMRAEGVTEHPIVLPERSALDITRWGKRFLTENRARPFFLWLHYFDAHRFYIVRPEFQARLPDDPYLAEILFADHQIGDLIRHLEALGLREDTLVVLVADHGEGLGEHDELMHSFFLYETTLRVPLILWGPPQLPAGKRIDQVVRTVDLVPTILDLLGLPGLPGGAGVSLMPIIRGESGHEELPGYAESIEIAMLFDGSPLRSIRSGRWKYIHQVEPELYDLANDPSELVNVAASQPQKVTELRGRMEALLAEASPPAGAANVPVDREEARRLRALGYLTGNAAAGFEAEIASLETHGPAPATLAGDINLLGKAEGLAGKGLHAQAEPMFAELLERHPDNPSVLVPYGRSLAALNRRAEARRAFEHAITVSSCSIAARLELGELLGAMAAWEEQLAVLRAGVEQCGESVELLNNYAYALATGPRDELRNGSEALRAAKRAAELTEADDPSVLDTLAAAYAEVGDFEQAVQVASRAVDLAERRGADPRLLAIIRQSLARYRAGRPTRVE